MVGFEQLPDSSFSTLELSNTKTFKYKLARYYTSIRSSILNVKRVFQTLVDKFKIYLATIDFKKLFSDASIWIVEALIEGSLINYTTHILFGLDFTVWTIPAYGIIFKKFIELVNEFKKEKVANDSNPEIFKHTTKR